MTTASIVAERCLVEVTSVKLLAPELYLKHEDRIFIRFHIHKHTHTQTYCCELNILRNPQSQSCKHKHAAYRQDLHCGLWLTVDRLDIDISNTQSVTNLITLGHTALSVYDNVALCYTVQEYTTKTKRF